MKSLILLLAAAAALGARADETVPEARVTLPYTEFRTLLGALEKPARPAPPVPSTIRSAIFRLAPERGVLAGTLALDVEAFGNGPQLVPLVSDQVAVSAIEPESASVVRKDGSYQLLLEGGKRASVTLRIALAGRREGGESTYRCLFAPSVVAALLLGPLPEGLTADVPGSVPGKAPGEFQIGAGNGLEIRLVERASDQGGGAVPMPPVVASASSETRVVRDGTFLSSTAWTVRHSEPVVWTLQPGGDAQIVSCLVDGRPQAPVQKADGSLEIRLAGEGGKSRVELVYTGKSSAFGPVRGDFSIALPSTPLLVERTEWKLVLPAAYSPVAVEGNAELQPSESGNELKLVKELSRGEAPSVRVFYQKPETKKTP